MITLTKLKFILLNKNAAIKLTFFKIREGFLIVIGNHTHNFQSVPEYRPNASNLCRNYD